MSIDNLVDKNNRTITKTNSEILEEKLQRFINTLLYPEKYPKREDKRSKKYRLTNEQRDCLVKYNTKKEIEDKCNAKTRATDLRIIANFTMFADKPYKKIAKDDITKYLESIKNMKDWTKRNISTKIKHFFQWLYGMDGGEYPDVVKWLNTGYSNKNNKLPEELLTPDDIENMVKSTDSQRDKALIFTGYESGCRASELLGIRLKHVVFDNYGAVIMVSGKTGQRRIRLINSVPDLKAWINTHPHKDNPESPLWVNIDCKRGYGNSFTNSTFAQTLKITAKRCGIRKNVYPHLLRHSRATELAKKGLNEQQLKAFFGWTPSSPMASIYIHLSGQDIDDKMLEINGKKKPEEKEKENSKLKPKTCNRCKEENPISNDFCFKCYNPLNEEAMNDIEQIKTSLSEYIAFVFNKYGIKPDDENLVKEFIKSKGGFVKPAKERKVDYIG